MPRKITDDFVFIQKLHQIICQTHTNFVGWMPKNMGFVINDQKMFTSQILLRNFGIERFDSFIRKLNRFGFKRSKVDKNKIRFFHKQFIRDSTNLANIKKLSKQQCLPKHIKLRMMRQKLSSESLSEQNYISSSFNTAKDTNKETLAKFQTIQQKQLLVFDKKNSIQKQEKQDIGLYLIKEIDTKNYKIKLAET